MLNSIKESASNSLTIKILLGLIAASFALWGIGDIFRGSSTTDIATVGNKRVTLTAFERALQDDMAQYSGMFGGNVPDVMRGAIEDGVEARLINRALLEVESNALGIRIPDEVAAQRISASEGFHADGTFSSERFKQMLGYNGISEGQYVQQLKQDLAVELLVNSILAGSVPLDLQAELLLRARGEKREVMLLTLPGSAVSEVADPDEQTLQQFYEAQGDRFSAPEYRRASILQLSRMEMIKQVDMSDEAITAQYEDNMTDYRDPAKYTVLSVTLPDEEIADGVRSALATGKTLEALHSENGSIPAQWTELGEMDATSLPAEALEALADVQDKGYSEPFATAFGVELYKVTDYTPPKQKSLEEAKPDITQQLIQGQMDDLLYDASIRLEDALAGGATLQEAAASTQASVTTAGPLDRGGKKPDGSAATQLPPVPGIAQAIFQQEPGDAARLTLAPNGVYYAVQVDEVIPPRTRALDEVRGTVTEAWKAEQRLGQLETLANSIAESARGGESLDKLAQAFGAEAPVTRVVERQDASSNAEGGAPEAPLPPALKTAVFAAETGEVVEPVKQADGSWVIAQLKDVKVTAIPEADLISLEASTLQSAWDNDVLDLYLEYLHGKHPVERLRDPTPVNVDALGAS